MTKAKVGPARTAKTDEGNKEVMRAICNLFNDIYSEMDYIEKALPHLSDRVGVVREKMRRIDEYKNNLTNGTGITHDVHGYVSWVKKPENQL